MHLRRLDNLECNTAAVTVPDLATAVAGRFPISSWPHDLKAFPMSVEVRYDPAESLGEGGPTTMWMRTKVPILADEEPTPFQRISPLADCGNGVSYNDYLDRVLFLNPDLEVSLHREPVGEWFCSKVRSHWQPDGTGLSDAELFDVAGPVGRAVQNLLLMPAG